MSFKVIVALGSLAAASVFAQAPLGTVGNVEGLVTITDGTTGTTAAPGSVITDGMRVVTTSRSSATLQLNNGCTLTLQPNQSVTVERRMTCQELNAAVRSVGGPGLALGGGVPAGGLISVAALGVAAFAVDKALGKNPNVSAR